jgi:hypothetical protein
MFLYGMDFWKNFFKVFRVWDELLVFFSLYLPPAWPSGLQPSVIAPEAGTYSDRIEAIGYVL